MGGFIGGGGVKILNSEGTVYFYDTSAAEETIGEVIVPAGLPGNGGIVSVQHCCTLNSSGVAEPFTFGVYLFDPDGVEYTSHFYDITDYGITGQFNYLLVYERIIQGTLDANGVNQWIVTETLEIGDRALIGTADFVQTFFRANSIINSGDAVIFDVDTTFRFTTQFTTASAFFAASEYYTRALKIC